MHEYCLEWSIETQNFDKEFQESIKELDELDTIYMKEGYIYLKEKVKI